MLEQNQGVVYHAQDYAGFFRRVGIILIDFVAIVALTVLLSLLFTISGIELGSFLVFGAYWILPICYMTLVKTSRLRTLGYRVAGVKIVTLQGTKPGFAAMIIRFLITLCGPFQLPFDFLWICNDPDKQSLRDKLLGTYVIKSDAVALRHGQIKARGYFILGFCLLFKEVDREAEEYDPA